jgi:hypothetical protein
VLGRTLSTRGGGRLAAALLAASSSLSSSSSLAADALARALQSLDDAGGDLDSVLPRGRVYVERGGWRWVSWGWRCCLQCRAIPANPLLERRRLPSLFYLLVTGRFFTGGAQACRLVAGLFAIVLNAALMYTFMTAHEQSLSHLKYHARLLSSFLLDIVVTVIQVSGEGEA